MMNRRSDKEYESRNSKYKSNNFIERNMIKLLNGKHGQDDRWEVTITNQMAKNYSQLHTDVWGSLTYSLNFKVMTETISNHIPFQ